MKWENTEYQRSVRDIIGKMRRAHGKKPVKMQESITLFFKSEADIIDPHSVGTSLGAEVINPAVIKYLKTRVKDFPRRKKITIDIKYSGIIPEDPSLPEKLIKKSLEVSIRTSSKRNFKITAGSFALALVGIGILAFINRVPFVNTQFAFNELFVVISWVFIWHFVELFFFERVKVRLKHERLIQIYLADYIIKMQSP